MYMHINAYHICFENGIQLYQNGRFNVVNVGFLMISRNTISSIHRESLGASYSPMMAG